MSLVKKVQNTIFQKSLLARGDRIILAVSGGPDSVVMLDIFSILRKKYDLQLIVAHVNYGLRGKDSEKDEASVRGLAKKYGMEIFVLRPDVGKNISENYLRDVRYEFFERVRKENRFDLVAVAHNMDDQVETFFMRVIRGSGLQGLSAMKYKNNRIIRPLLSISRKEIEEYAKEHELKFRIDKTNRENFYLRNKIRNKLLPYLEKNFSPSIRKTVFDSIESIADDYALVSEMSDQSYGDGKVLSVKALLLMPPAIRKRVILKAIADKKSGNGDIEASHVNEIMKILSSTKGKRQIFRLGGLKVERVGDRLEIERLRESGLRTQEVRYMHK